MTRPTLKDILKDHASTAQRQSADFARQGFEWLTQAQNATSQAEAARCARDAAIYQKYAAEEHRLSEVYMYGIGMVDRDKADPASP